MSEHMVNRPDGVGRDGGHIPEAIQEFVKKIDPLAVPELSHQLRVQAAPDILEWERDMQSPEQESINPENIAAEIEKTVNELTAVLNKFFDSSSRVQSEESGGIISQQVELESVSDGLGDISKLDDSKVLISRSFEQSNKREMDKDCFYTIELIEDNDHTLLFLVPEDLVIHQWYMRKGKKAGASTRASGPEDVYMLQRLTNVVRELDSVRPLKDPDA